MMKPLRCCALVTLLGCGASALPEPPASRAPAVTSDATRAAESGRRVPVAARLSGPASPVPGEPLLLTATIERNVALGVPLQVSLELPAGVELLEGERVRELSPNTQVDSHELRFVIRAAAMPTEDVKLVVQARGRGFGVHTVQPYRFGRSAPVPVSMPRAGQELRVGEHSFGRSVALPPP